MKYIKIFEEYSSDFYQEITKYDWANLNWANSISFSEKDFNRLKDKFKKLTFTTNNKYELIRVNSNINSYFTKFSMKIYKLVDEYYYINLLIGYESIDRFYKCDQLEGVEKFLNDLINDVYVTENASYQNFYTLLTQDEWEHWVINSYTENKISFDKKEVYKIERYFNEKDREIFQSENDCMQLDYLLFQIKIYKADDSYYHLYTYINQKEKAYKCDQFDGLIKCLDEEVFKD